MKLNKYMIGMQVIFLLLVLTLILFLYPKTEVNVSGNVVKFDSAGANVIIISENPDFSNPRYLDLSETDSVSFSLKPGKYYWKSDNGIIESFKGEFIIESKVGMIINRSEEESDLVNIGNVKINVTKSKKGIMIGHVILEPDEGEEIEDDNEKYTGRQEE